MRLTYLIGNRNAQGMEIAGVFEVMDSALYEIDV
jgi:hypothetical protein